jgi:hypothetical protein
MQEDASRSCSFCWVSSMNLSRLMACIFGETGLAELSVAIMYKKGTGKRWLEIGGIYHFILLNFFVVILQVYPNLHLIQNLYAL